MIVMPQGTSRVVSAALVGAALLACGGTGPSRDPAFVTSASSYTLTPVNEVPQVTINYTYQNDDEQLAALQGCTGGNQPIWWLEKQVGGSWREAYPAVCEANPNAGVAVPGGGQFSGSITIMDGVAGGADPMITHRPVAGTYRLRFGLFDRINQQTGVGHRVTDGRQFSNTFSLQE